MIVKLNKIIHKVCASIQTFS